MTDASETNLGPDDELHLDDGVDLDDQIDDQGQPDLDNPDDDDEVEDFEFEGKTLAVPKSVKDALAAGLLRQADYTKKTQELADMRRAADTERAVQATETHTFLQENARLLTINEQIAAFANVDWAAAAAEDATNGTQKVTLARIELDALKEAREKLQGDIKTKSDNRARETQQATAKQIEERDAVLNRDIPKWGEKRPKVEAFAKANGVTPEELNATADPRIFKLLELAMDGAAARQKQRVTTTIQAEQQVRPAAVVNASRKGPITAADQARMSADDWAKYRNEQLARKNNPRGR